MNTGTLNTDIKGRFGKWEQGTRVIVLSQSDGAAFIERAEPLRGPGKMMPLTDQMVGVPMDCLDLDQGKEGQ
jgi:hypothetical protein